MSRSCGKRRARGSWKTGSMVYRRVWKETKLCRYTQLSWGNQRGGAEPRKPRREKLLVYSVNKYLMSVCYTLGTVLGDMVRMEMGNILVPGEMNILPELTSEVSYQAAVRSIRK